MVTLLFLGLAVFVWSKSRRNGDDVIATFEVLLAATLLVMALCCGGLHLPLACLLLTYALLLPAIREVASRSAATAAATSLWSFERRH